MQGNEISIRKVVYLFEIKQSYSPVFLLITITNNG